MPDDKDDNGHPWRHRFKKTGNVSSDQNDYSVPPIFLLLHILFDEEAAYDFLWENDILKGKKCPCCGFEMKLKTRYHHKNWDIICCGNIVCDGEHMLGKTQITESVFKGTFFDKSKLPINEVLFSSIYRLLVWNMAKSSRYLLGKEHSPGIHQI